MLGESVSSLDTPKEVIVRQRPVDYQVCPHCDEEIHEKGVYADEHAPSVLRHRPCGGAIKMPPVDWSKISPEWRAALQRHTS
jgi:hypothetical protein